MPERRCSFPLLAFFSAVLASSVMQPGLRADESEGPVKVAAISDFDDWVVSLAWSRDSKTLYCGSYENVVTWSVDSKDTTAQNDQVSGYASSLLPISDSQLLIGGYQKALLLDLKTGEILREFRGHRGQVTGLAMVGEKSFVSCSDDGTVQLQTVDGEVVRKWSFELPATSMVVIPGKELAVIGLGDETRVTQPGSIAFLDLSDEALPEPTELHKSAVTSVRLSDDGKSVLSASFDETVIVTSIESREPTGIFREHARPVNCLAMVPSTEWVVSGSGGRFKKKNELKIWQLTSGRVAFNGEPHGERIRCVAVSPDGKYLAVGSYDETVSVWDISAFAK